MNSTEPHLKIKVDGGWGNELAPSGNIDQFLASHIADALMKTTIKLCVDYVLVIAYMSKLTLAWSQWLPNNYDMRQPTYTLTHWGRDKTAAFFRTFSNAFSWMKMYEFR